EVVQLRERGSVERAGGDTLHAQRAQAAAQLTRRLGGEGDRHHAAGRVRAGVDAVRDAVRDDAGLPGAGACQHAHRSAQGRRGLPLPLVQARQRGDTRHRSFPSSQSRISVWAIEAAPGSTTSLRPSKAAWSSSRENQRTDTISSPSGRASSSREATAQNPTMRERGYGQACEPRYWRCVTLIPDSSAISRCTAPSSDSPASTNPAKQEYRFCPHRAFEPSSRREPSSLPTATITAGSV